MSGDADERDELRRDLAELQRTLEALRRELEPGDRRRLRPPSFRELRRFTTEVTIPAAILVLETNVRALKILQRALRLAEDSGGAGGRGVSDEVRDRATEAGRLTLSGLDDALTDLQDALAGEPADDDARALLDEARALQTSVDDRLAEEELDDLDGVQIDVEAELDSIREAMDDDNDGDGDGDDAGDGDGS